MAIPEHCARCWHPLLSGEEYTQLDAMRRKYCKPCMSVADELCALFLSGDAFTIQYEKTITVPKVALYQQASGTYKPVDFDSR